MPYFILAAAVTVVISLSIWNDHQIQKKGGDTEYIWEHFHKD